MDGVLSFAVSLLPLSPKVGEWVEKLGCFRSSGCTGETSPTRSVLVGMNVAFPEKEPNHNVGKLGF